MLRVVGKVALVLWLLFVHGLAGHALWEWRTGVKTHWIVPEAWDALIIFGPSMALFFLLWSVRDIFRP